MCIYKIQFGYLASNRRPVKDLYEIINQIVSKHGKNIEWHKRGYNVISLSPEGKIYFRMRGGNKFVKWLELMSHNLVILGEIKLSFPDLFKSSVELKSGLL